MRLQSWGTTGKKDGEGRGAATIAYGRLQLPHTMPTPVAITPLAPEQTKPVCFCVAKLPWLTNALLYIEVLASLGPSATRTRSNTCSHAHDIPSPPTSMRAQSIFRPPQVPPGAVRRRGVVRRVDRQARVRVVGPRSGARTGLPLGKREHAAPRLRRREG